MSKKEDIEKVVNNYIESIHNTGTRSGGSGHLGHVSYTLDEVNYKDLRDGFIEVNIKYTLITETEFTYYPDNPPYEYKYQKKIIINQNGRVLKEFPKKGTSNIL